MNQEITDKKAKHQHILTKSEVMANSTEHTYINNNKSVKTLKINLE